MLHGISTLALILIFAGVYFRKKRALHMSLLLSAFVIDVLLVLYIELTRHAVEKVVSNSGPLLWFHVFVSVVALGLYVFQVRLGYLLYRGIQASRGLHIKCGMAFILFRVMNYITSFMVTS